MTLEAAKFIPWIAAFGAVLCGVLCMKPRLKHYAGWVCVASIAAGFLLTALPLVGGKVHFDKVEHSEVTEAQVVKTAPWIQVGGKNDKHDETGEIIDYVGGLQIDFGYYFDGLTLIMLLVVCGIGTLFALYAVGYMKGDPGVPRFFGAMALFIFAMTTLVMADNLVLLFLGWEGVGLCSYLLIGYYYDKPTAVAAAKKAFIVNRIGDLGFLVAIFLTFKVFGSVNFADVLPAVQAQLGMIPNGELAGGSEAAFKQLSGVLDTDNGSSPWLFYAIPFCLMVGAFGKSAQIPLFVWLPDAMAGPTPVSALVHAATMVTAGVYLIARCMPIFMLGHVNAETIGVSPLHVVAVVGGVTALFAGTIALCNNDLKGVFAYSTVSQLGYMFLGLGCAAGGAAVFHLVTHAFFKALLFLTAGSVMHALAGTLDIRKMGGMGKHMPVTKWLMFAGCLALAGFPFTAGFFSKDEILAAAMMKGTGSDGSWMFFVLAIMGLITAFLTAFYTFRLWCIVFTGETKYEMGDDHHSEDDGDGHDDHSHHGPHEMPLLPMNLPLFVLAVGAIVAGFLLSPMSPVETLKIEHAIAQSSAVAHGHDHGTYEAGEHGQAHGGDDHGDHDHEAAGGEHEAKEPGAVAHESGHDDHGAHGEPIMGLDAHTFMMVLSSLIAILGIALAAVFYWLKPAIPKAIGARFHESVRLLQGKYFIDEMYDRVVVQPLNIAGKIFFLIDQLVIHATVEGLGRLPLLAGRIVRPTQSSGKLQGYGLGMVIGIAGLAILMLIFMTR